MWRVCLFALFIFVRGAHGSLAEEMAGATELCCNKGTGYARNHSSEDCSSSIPPDVPSMFGSLCLFAMDQCCKEYFQKKRECDGGVDIASNQNQCSSASGPMKSCCNECLKGIAAKGRGEQCSAKTHGITAEELLPNDAYMQCCMKDDKVLPKEDETTNPETSLTVLSRKHSETIASLCEEYAPNELCAHHCIPVPGSYRCECNPGFMLMADGRNCKEVVKNRCKPKNPCQHKCNDNGVEVKCSCRRGYQLMKDGKSCEDIDECQLEPPVCLPGTKCYNILGSYKCIPTKKPTNIAEKGKCPPGFVRNMKNNACDDVNECELHHPPCPSYLCENTIGAYKCGGATGDPASLANNNNNKPVVDDRCPPGFKAGMNEECEDVDECAQRKDDCNHQSQFCINTRGSFHCQNKVSKHCPPGFKIDPVTNRCEDIDECTEDGEDICRADQVCVNVPGEYDCKSSFRPKAYDCPEGMRFKRGSTVCEDIDECAEGTHLCDQYQNCLNTNGSHECHCKLGFELDSTTGACIDVNECATEQHNCIVGSQRCDNTVGSYLCIRFTSCGTGYILHHSTSQCEDIDECTLGTHNCARAGPEYQCENHPGSFRCVRKTTSTAAPPVEYEYEYYDSEEEVPEKNPKKDNPETKSEEPPTTVTSKPEPSTQTSSTSTTTQPTTPAQPFLTGGESYNNEILPKNEEPKAEPGYLDPYVGFQPTSPQPEPQQPEIPPSSPVQTEVVQPNTFDPYLPPQQPAQPTETTPEQTTIVPDPDIQTEPVTNNESIPPDSTSNQPETERPETTYKPEPTPPHVVYVSVGKETATVNAEKNDDGSVVVNTGDVPKNEWTGVNERPTNCQIGFELDQYGACYDIDECTTGRHACSERTEVCRNTVGGYLCECAAGFRRDTVTGACDFIITTSSTTSTTPPPPTAPSSTSLFWGYPDYRPMTNRPFRPRNLCDVGYHLNSQSGKCEDIDECTNGQANCAAVEICVNTQGGYRCECPPNWRLDEIRHRCIPLKSNGQFPPGYGNEPVYPPVHEGNLNNRFAGTQFVEPEVTQIEDRGSVITCPTGYKLGYDNTCEDIDECATDQAKCGEMMCTNLPGGYVCSCPAGHKLVEGNRCEDVDECSLARNMPICSQNADCVNTVGSYQCRCHGGFRSAPVNDKVCVDMDECTESPAGSLCQHRCNNVWGGYRCSCHRGYRLNSDNRTCSDIDECVEFKSKLLCIGRCLNEPGSYRCSCPSGYRLSEDKRSCIDIDECETGEAPCAKGGSYSGTSNVCLNTRGSYRCHRIICPTGYRLENRHRCTRIEKVCSPADWECAHQPTTYSYNFITFVSKLYIPASKVDLFTMRGPAWPNAKMRFQLRLVDVNAPPSIKDTANINAFLLQQTGNQAVMSLVRSLEGPQSIELELSMELYNGDQFGGIAVARLYIYVSEYEF